MGVDECRRGAATTEVLNAIPLIPAITDLKITELLTINPDIFRLRRSAQRSILGG
jgi:hypothetical protein